MTNNCFFCVSEKKKCSNYNSSRKFSNSNKDFFSLTPSDDINVKDSKDDINVKDSKFEIYENALNFALSENNIHNIAITGSYGSGKSTIIDSYFKNKCRKELLKISLATFFIKKDDNNSQSKNNIQEIEKSILQQIFYRKKANRFPFSRFKRILSYNFFQICIIEFCIIASIIFLSILLKSNWLVDFFNPQLLADFIIKIVFSSFFLISGFFLTRFILKIRLTKFSFQKIEFFLGEIENESLLNRHLDEILYFFEKTDYNTVVFEDLDRFEKPEIFFHLRELNSIINNYEAIKRKVVFIYAIRDELFENNKNDRIKFFDFIIPIVPVIDTNNSSDKLAILLHKNDYLKNVDKEFLSNVCKFVNDLRFLKNCINEFLIFKDISNISNMTNLFAFIIYKNFFPKYSSNLANRIKDINSGRITVNEPLEEFLIVKTKILNLENINSISRYYSINITETDKDNDYIQLVNKNKEPIFNYKLENNKVVFNNLRENKKIWQGLSIGILNNNLLDFLLENKCDSYLLDFIKTMYQYDKKYPENSFFIQYNYTNKNISKQNECIEYFYNKINKYIITDVSLTYDVLFKNNIKLCDFFLITNEINDKLKDYIKQEICTSLAESNVIEKVIQKLKLYSIKINIHSSVNKNTTLMNKIIKEQIFDISRNNLELLLESEKVKINRNCLFSEIMNSQSLKYLLNSEDVEQVVEAIIDVNSDHLLEENEEAMLTIINDRNIKLDKRKQFIRKNKTILSSLSDVDEKECLINLLDQNKVKPCWYNIESCLSKIGPVSALKEFINNNLYILKNDNSISIYDIQKIIHDINDSEIEHNFKDLK